jgi:hypothetical protein
MWNFVVVEAAPPNDVTKNAGGCRWSQGAGRELMVLIQGRMGGTADETAEMDSMNDEKR